MLLRGLFLFAGLRRFLRGAGHFIEGGAIDGLVFVVSDCRSVAAGKVAIYGDADECGEICLGGLEGEERVYLILSEPDVLGDLGSHSLGWCCSGATETLCEQVIDRFANECAAIFPPVGQQHQHVELGDLIFVQAHSCFPLPRDCVSPLRGMHRTTSYGNA